MGPNHLTTLTLDLASGSVIAQACRRHRQQEFLRFLKLIDAAVPRDLDLALTRNQVRFTGTGAITDMLTEPTSTQRQAFDLIGVPIPLTLK